MTTEITTMINLSAIAYQEAKDIAAAVTAYASDLSVVWGPAWRSFFGNPYSLGFVVKSASTGALTVVIRGTNPVSLSSWLNEDLHIDATVPFTNYVPGAPSGALLSKGTATALDHAIEQKPESGYAGKGIDLLTYLQGVEGLASVTVTGHSLGGTLTPVLYAWLYENLVTQGDSTPQMDLMSFAGLTPGNQAFADYLDTIISGSPAWRVVNPMDVAPRCFTSQDEVKNIYTPDGVDCGRIESGLIDHLFSVAAVPYVQPGGGELELPGSFDPSESSWASQALHQHHAATYLSLVEQLK